MVNQSLSTREQRRRYHPKTAAEAFQRIVQEIDPWIAIGDFLDDWQRTPAKDRRALTKEAIAEADYTLELQRWAAFFAVMIETLCEQGGLPVPAWTAREAYHLAERWYLYPGKRMRAWTEETTPAPFKMRNIFGGDRMLDRV